MDWSAYIEHLQSLLKEFDSIAALIDKFLIYYFRNSPRSSIRIQLNKRDGNPNNWQTVIEQSVDAKA